MTLPSAFQSRKFQASAFVTVLIGIPFIATDTDPNLTRLQKRDAAIEFVKSLATVWGISIGGTALEDAAAKYNPVGGTQPIPPTPPAQVTDSRFVDPRLAVLPPRPQESSGRPIPDGVPAIPPPPPPKTDSRVSFPKAHP